MAKDIDPRLNVRETVKKILDLQQSYLMLECQFRKLASY